MHGRAGRAARSPQYAALRAVGSRLDPPQNSEEKVPTENPPKAQTTDHHLFGRIYIVKFIYFIVYRSWHSLVVYAAAFRGAAWF